MKTLLTVLALACTFGLSTANAQSFNYGSGGPLVEDTHNVITTVESWCYLTILGGDEELRINTLEDGAYVYESNTAIEYGTNSPNPSSITVTHLRVADRGAHLNLGVEGLNLLPHPAMLEDGFRVHYPGASEGVLTGFVPLSYGGGGVIVENIRTGGGSVDLQYRLGEHLFGAPGRDVTEVTYTITADCGGVCQPY